MPVPSAIDPAEVEAASCAFSRSTCAHAHPAKLARAGIHCVRIGDISLSLVSRGDDDISLDPGLEAFRARSSSPEICLDVSWQSGLRARQQSIFDSQSLW